MRITVAVGTRPEIIKLSPVVRALRQDGHELRVVATGQHADPTMAAHMFDEMGYQPDVTWSLPSTASGRPGAITANAIEELARVPADVVLVLGDTDTALLVALAARHRGIGVIHVEAGLRSFNGQSAEEVNRRVMAATATLNLAPTPIAAQFLFAEGVPPRRVHVVGNPVIDGLVASGVPRHPVAGRRGVLFTAHRATNVDRPERLREMTDLLADLGRRHGPVTFPLHPRTQRRLTDAGLIEQVMHMEGVQAGPPLSYQDMLERLARCKLVVTDSGGLQEEAAYFGVPVIIMRETTPRWESIQARIAVLSGLDRQRVLDGVEHFLLGDRLAEVACVPCPYGAGDAGRRIAALLREEIVQDVLLPRERDFDMSGAHLLADLFAGSARERPHQEVAVFAPAARDPQEQPGVSSWLSTWP
jgi:UDP-N-acetylglucosamine 2-epimerase (non-hydrolysing)